MHLGDTVLAYDPTTGKAEPELVQHVWVNHDSDLIDVGLQSSASSGSVTDPTSTTVVSAPRRGKHLVAAWLALAAALAISGHAGVSSTNTAHSATSHTSAASTIETVHTTANHPWLTADRGWVAAGELQPGEQVVTLAGGGVSTVAWVHVVPGQADYYNLTVAKDHTYAVGGTQAVVHNDTCFGPNDPSNDPSQAAARQRIGFAREAAHGERAGVWVMDENGRPFAEESSGAAVFSPYGPATMYSTADGAGTCAEFRCGASVEPLYNSGLPRGSELYMYLYHGNFSPPCGSCRNMLTRWAQDNQAPIHVYWLGKNDNLWGQTFG